jgi:hypothetical protein
MKTKQKFKSAEQAQSHRELNKSWEDLTKKYTALKSFSSSITKVQKTNSLSTKPHKSNKDSIPSLVTLGGSAVLKVNQAYTGTKMLGVAVLHKSNAVPVFSTEEIIDVARMRR